jgi:hypothetical protein
VLVDVDAAISSERRTRSSPGGVPAARDAIDVTDESAVQDTVRARSRRPVASTAS